MRGTKMVAIATSAELSCFLTTPMKYGFLFCFLALFFFKPSAQAGCLLQPNDRVALCGGNLGDTPVSVYIETYLMGTQGIPGLDFAQFGWLAPNTSDIQAD